MDPKAFDKLMTDRHSARYFQKKPIPESILKEIMSTEELKKTNPWILIDYYEGKIKFA